ncbi:MAG: hypothetical protein OEY23_02825 [Acidimicrobiia bacterium]|nr:hypothetical protein [Acidimicrobiia bacterium]
MKRYGRLPSGLAGAVLVMVGALLAFGGVASAESGDAPGGGRPAASGPVEIVKVSGLLDEVLVDFVHDQIERAADEDATAVVLQLNSSGAVVPDGQVAALARAMVASPVPVAVWVGPSGAQATGAAAQLVAVAKPAGIAAGAQFGRAGPQVLPEAEFGALWGDQRARVEDGLVRGVEENGDLLVDLGVVFAPVLGDFIIDLEGVAVNTVGEGVDARREPATDVVFSALPLAGQLMHTVASPPVAYLLFVIGLGLLVFELYTAGIGVAGAVGAVCLALGCYGIVALPVRAWAAIVLGLAFLAFAVDVQTGVPRFWTGVGMLAFVVGTLALYPDAGMSWITKLVGVVGVALTFLSGMPSMVRTRFSTPTIGRSWMVGEMGLALSEVSPDGTVSVRSARWPAHTNRATPIHAGDRVRVVGIAGVVLEVEPEQGGARDYRERRSRA